MKIETILTPAELPALAQRDLRATACVVFDVLRATSTFVTALHHGAQAIIPVSEIAEAVALKNSKLKIKNSKSILLGGERNGVRISAEGIDFDLGNSPREYRPEKVRGKIIVSTTTNGTRALRACVNAQTVLAASFLNLTATAEFLRRENFTSVLLVCAGTGENTALEDVLAAGALCELLVERDSVEPTLKSREIRARGTLAPPHKIDSSDSAQIALLVWLEAKSDLAGAVSSSANARRLLAIPELREDVAFCLQQDICPLVARMGADGKIGCG
ncbi:MAG: 2-phosphosulfolactate phosphatase [Verrucomicrobiales bacterium]|nr:2-phosphosulfolactate phosphatase [Verrucomicrobiales bacterium]